MKLHPDYLAAFHGGRHPMHPASRAFHGLYRSGVVRETRERVWTLANKGDLWLWYRRDDFVRLCRGARDARYRAIADEFGQQEVASE